MNHNLTIDDACQVLKRLVGEGDDKRKAWPFWYNGTGIVYYAKGQLDAKGNFWPSVFNLVQGLGSYFSSFRGYTIYVPYTIEITPICKGAIDFYSLKVERLTAKRPREEGEKFDKSKVNNKSTEKLRIEEVKIKPPDFRTLENRIPKGSAPDVNLDSARQTHLHRLYMTYAYEITGATGEDRKREGHRIGAVIATKEGVVKAVGVNQHFRNTTFHAEILLLMLLGQRENFQSRFSKEWCVIYATLKPCKMCAAAIAYHLPNSRVFYNQNDPRQSYTQSPKYGILKLSESCTYPGEVYSKDMKPVRHKKKGDLSCELEALYSRHGNTVTAVLNSEDGEKLIKAAVNLLNLKAAKYQDAKSKIKYGLDDVRKVLVYLGKLKG